MSDTPFLDRMAPVDWYTALTASFWTAHEDNIENFVLQFLPLVGGTMLGPVSWYSTQTFQASAVLCAEPTYTHSVTAGPGLFTVADHISDETIHTTTDSPFVMEFTNTEVVSGALVVSHNMGITYPAVIVINSSEQTVTPTGVTYVDDNSVNLDLSGVGSITGTWHVSCR